MSTDVFAPSSRRTRPNVPKRNHASGGGPAVVRTGGVRAADSSPRVNDAVLSLLRPLVGRLRSPALRRWSGAGRRRWRDRLRWRSAPAGAVGEGDQPENDRDGRQKPDRGPRGGADARGGSRGSGGDRGEGDRERARVSAGDGHVVEVGEVARCDRFDRVYAGRERRGVGTAR